MRKINLHEINSQLKLPFLETNEIIIEKIFRTLKMKFELAENSKQKLIDLGSGNGCIIIYSALNYGIKSIGIEINLNLITEAKNYIKLLKKENSYQKKLFKNITFIHGDLFEVNLKDFDFIYIFSLPTMQTYLHHVFLTAKKDSIIISYKYPLTGFKDILKMAYELRCDNKDQMISTFYYKKFKNGD